jgi:hypothetical protein
MKKKDVGVLQLLLQTKTIPSSNRIPLIYYENQFKKVMQMRGTHTTSHAAIFCILICSGVLRAQGVCLKIRLGGTASLRSCA